MREAVLADQLANITSFEPPLISTGRKRKRNLADKIPPIKLRKVGVGWNISKRAPIRIEDVEVTPPPATPSPPRRSKRLRKKQFID